MNARSRSKSGAANKAPISSRSKGRNIQHDDMDVDGTGKENSISRGQKHSKKPKTTSRKPKLESRITIDCICTKGDDGSPMILCAECKIWYVIT
ncbi:hypothetical protein CPC08DRAFT_140809 [Agrocybe pediades]|nr:hypothetical protein CPC08DRAFT_140809 [Agrocybe pediades]